MHHRKYFPTLNQLKPNALIVSKYKIGPFRFKKNVNSLVFVFFLLLKCKGFLKSHLFRQLVLLNILQSSPPSIIHAKEVGSLAWIISNSRQF